MPVSSVTGPETECSSLMAPCMKRMHVQNSSPDSALRTRTLQRICAPEHVIETPVTLFKSALQMSVSRGTAVFNHHALSARHAVATIMHLGAWCYVYHWLRMQHSLCAKELSCRKSNLSLVSNRTWYIHSH